MVMAGNANNDELKVVVLTPSRKLAEESCTSLQLPTPDGEIGILPQHAPLVTKIGSGVLHYDKSDRTTFFAVSGGVAEIRDNVVTVLVDLAEEASTIDVARAQRSLERARARLTTAAAAVATSETDMSRAMAAEARAAARLEAASRLASGRK